MLYVVIMFLENEKSDLFNWFKEDEIIQRNINSL